MMDFNLEKEIFSRGYGLLGAIDEAGRGPLAGPVVAACVLVDKSFQLDEKEFNKINDSKKVAAKMREELFDIINDNFEVGIGVCDHATVDRINILEASFLAMKKAIGALKKKPEFIILDGKFLIPNFSIRQQAIIKGDSQVFSIATASIIAKVTRDRIMKEMHEKFPQYGFDRHKGYGTKLHMENLRTYGPCLIHRKSFAPVKRCLKRKIVINESNL